MQHNDSPEAEQRIREGALDETIAESFPASDPPSTLPNPDNDETPETTKDDGSVDRDRASRRTSERRPHRQHVFLQPSPAPRVVLLARRAEL